ncbi:tripartite motif-containing protein 2-like [Stylophora pistillata]|nr:tripartite motif-containing protein 2-like [Stylophora pistillata]
MLHALTASKEIVDQGDLNVKHEIKLNIDTQKGTFKRQFAHPQIFLKHNTRSPTEGLHGFLNHLENDYHLSTKELKFDCFEVGMTCPEPIFERPSRDYRNGKLNKLAERFLLTNKVQKKLNLHGIGIRTVVKEEELVKSSRRVSKSGVITAVMRIEIVTQNHGTCNRKFASDINIFKKRDSFSSSNGLGDFLKRVARDYFLETPFFGFGCLEVRMECPSLEILEKLWKNYRSGRLNEIVKRYLLTDEEKNEAELNMVNLTTLIKDDEYNSCRKSFSEVAEQLGGGVSPGTIGEPHEVKIKVSLDQIDLKKEEKFNQHLVEQISMLMEYNTFSPSGGVGKFIEYIRNVHNLLIKSLGLGCLEIQVECLTLESLEGLKNDYCSGDLNEMAEKFILTDEVREELDLNDVSFKTTIKREDYLACRKSFLNEVEPFSEITNPEIIASSHTDHSKSQPEGNGLKEAEQGAEANFTITTRDSEGKQIYSEQEHVIVTIRSPRWGIKAETIDLKDGNYSVGYKPKCAGRHDVTIEIEGWPLTGSPWRVKVKPLQYKVIKSCGSPGNGEGEFNGPRSIVQNKFSGDIAVVDTLNNRLQVFDENLKYLRTIGGEVGSPTGEAVMIDHPLSVAFLRDGDMVVIHSIECSPTHMSLITEDGQFIRKFSERVFRPSTVFVRNGDDGDHVIACDKADRKIKVLSPDGVQLLQFFGDPDCDDSPACVFYHCDKFFVSYHLANCIKVFNEEGEFIFNIGCEGSGEGLLNYPCGLVVDAFDNLIVCDNRSNRLQMFTQDGEFLSSFYQEIQSPWGMAISKTGDLLLTDMGKQRIIILQ